MRICFFYRLKGGKTSYEYIKSFIRHLKKIHSKVIYFPDFFQRRASTFVESLSGYVDSNQRPSAPKILNSHGSALGFQAISNYLLGSANFVVTNKVIFVRNLSAKY